MLVSLLQRSSGGLSEDAAPAARQDVRKRFGQLAAISAGRGGSEPVSCQPFDIQHLAENKKKNIFSVPSSQNSIFVPPVKTNSHMGRVSSATRNGRHRHWTAAAAAFFIFSTRDTPDRSFHGNSDRQMYEKPTGRLFLSSRPVSDVSPCLRPLSVFDPNRNRID
jgi:hypothetical protein